MLGKRMVTYLGSAAIALALGALVASSAASAGDDRLRLRCDAEGAGDTSMDAKYEDRQRRNRTKFDASFEAAPGGSFFAGDILEVRVGGVLVGTMELVLEQGDLQGDLNFDTTAQPDDDDLPFPDNFPEEDEIGEGTSVVVDTLGCDLS